MKIIQLTAENVKRLVAVEIKPDGNMVQITGKNGSGKTSVLDSIWWSLAGAKHIQSAPIRKGANHARIKLDMGELVVTRTFHREKDSDGYTTKLEVAGAVKGTPQQMLDSLLDSLAFDPLKFARMDAKDQFEALKKYVPDVDFDKIAGSNSIDMANRKEINRSAKELRVLADRIVIPDNAPSERIDETALVTELARAGKHNADIQIEAEKRKTTQSRVASMRVSVEELRRKAAVIIADADALEREASEMEGRLNDAPALAEMVDGDAIQQRLVNAKKANLFATMREDKARHEKRAAELEAQSEQLTKQMEDREADKRAKISAAKLPVEAITFGDGVVLLNGVPFDQASDAEQLKASCALAMAGNPQLKVVRVRDGSLLDEEGLALLGRMADERGFQVWIERVGTGEVGFILEDGHLREREKAAGQQELLA